MSRLSVQAPGHAGLEQCEGEGSIPVEDDIVSICDACGGRIGILSSFKRGRRAEMISTQLHLRAAS